MKAIFIGGTLHRQSKRLADHSEVWHEEHPGGATEVYVHRSEYAIRHVGAPHAIRLSIFQLEDLPEEQAARLTAEYLRDAA